VSRERNLNRSNEIKAIFLTSPQTAVILIAVAIAAGAALHATAWFLNRSK